MKRILNAILNAIGLHDEVDFAIYVSIAMYVVVVVGWVLNGAPPPCSF